MMDKDPLLSGDWLKMTIKYPGLCLICKKRVSPAEVGYWSRTAKSILHEDCYELTVFKAKKKQGVFNNKTNQSKKMGEELLSDFITKRQNKEKCFICGSKIDFHESLILTLLKLERNVSTLESFFCSTCLSRSDPLIFEEYKLAFSKNLKSS
jgi:hypothetical protein